MTAALVIGIGNESRGDDGAGLLVARAVAAEALPDLSVLESDGEPAGLMQAWAGARDVYIADCCAPMGSPGTIHRFAAQDGPLPERLGAISSHGFGLGMTIELARAMDALPPRLTVFAIEGADFAPGAAMSSQIREAASRVAHRICAELLAKTDAASRATAPSPQPPR